MKNQPTPAQPRSEKDWDGFRFTAYSLDPKRVLNLPLTRKRIADGKTEEIQTTVGEIYKSLANCRPEIESWPGEGMEITTDTEKLGIAGLPFNRDVLKELLRLRGDGVNPFTADWFWYDRDSARNMPQAFYSFFVVHDDRIVRENVSFCDYDSYDYATSGFDPFIFLVEDDSHSVWRDDAAWKDARIRFWYRKFYSETRKGQLMVLRNDEPALCDYHRGTGAADLLLHRVLNLLGKIHVLLWVLVVLGGLILLRFWR